MSAKTNGERLLELARDLSCGLMEADEQRELGRLLYDAALWPGNPLRKLSPAGVLAEPQAVDMGRDAVMFRNSMRLLTNFDVHRYLMSCADGRQNGALKAHHHIALCTSFVAALTGEVHDSARMRHPELYEAIHSATQDALTDRMDEVIGFPLSGRPDYDALAPEFFDVFFDAAMATFNDSQAVVK